MPEKPGWERKEVLHDSEHDQAVSVNLVETISAGGRHATMLKTRSSALAGGEVGENAGQWGRPISGALSSSVR